MARPTRDEIIAIITKQSPNLDVVDTPVRAKPRAEAGTPSLAALRKKWIGKGAAAAVDALDKLDDEDLASVTLKPKNDGAIDQAGDDKAKAAVVSSDTGDIIGKQG